MFDELNDLYQQVILDHCKHPRNFHDLDRPTCSAQGHNPLCGDQLTLYLALEGEVIQRHQLCRLRLLHLQGLGLPADRGGQRQDPG